MTLAGGPEGPSSSSSLVGGGRQHIAEEGGPESELDSRLM